MKVLSDNITHPNRMMALPRLRLASSNKITSPQFEHIKAISLLLDSVLKKKRITGNHDKLSKAQNFA